MELPPALLGRRIVLLNTVLDALLTFAMGAVELPPPVLIRVIEGLRRSFLWNIQDCLLPKVDRYLSGWISLLLSSGGRIVLLNVVLDALPTFAMGAVELPLC